MTPTPIPDPALRDATARVALAAVLHDIGKFAKRAGLGEGQAQGEEFKAFHSPSSVNGGDHSHAADSARVLKDWEQAMPGLTAGTMFPFSSWGNVGEDESLVATVAQHHRPETCLHWIMAAADRAAWGWDEETFQVYSSGVAEQDESCVTRQGTLFEQVRLTDPQANRDTCTPGTLRLHYPLRKFAPESIFPEAGIVQESAARAEYGRLWKEFTAALGDIPESHIKSLPLWLDHFDTLWMIFTHAMPASTSAVVPDVSLYDHSRVVAALAAALWRYHHERSDDPESVCRAMETGSDWNEAKVLLVQGDLFGIQDFIFADGGETQRRAARLLRGRSFYVSLLTECAALKILDALDLPPTSQLTNAAGKFLIVAPHTQRTVEIVQRVQRELDQWFLDHTYGQSGIGLAWHEASGHDLQSGQESDSPYGKHMRRLFEELERVKLRRFDFCGDSPPVPNFESFLDRFHNAMGPCAVDGRLPAETRYDDIPVSWLAKDQMEIGSALPKQDRVVVGRRKVPVGRGTSLHVPIFGFAVQLTNHTELEALGSLDANILRVWDISLPDDGKQVAAWHGCARRYVNSYVPFKETSAGGGLEIKDFNALAKAAVSDEGKGVAALMTVKGDVDDLGRIFQGGLPVASFTRTAALSRQLNAFFALYLPWLCQQEFGDIYTVFAGGDDFFLIGPWHRQMKLVERIRKEFQRYVGENPDIHFSVGLVMTKPGIPVRYLAERGEQALETAKEFHQPSSSGLDIRKNAVHCFGRTVSWDRFERLLEIAARLQEEGFLVDLSASYVYNLLEFMRMRAEMKKDPRNARWRALFVHRTWRMLERQHGLSPEARRQRYERLARLLIEEGIEPFCEDFQIALFPFLYNQREA